MTRRSHRGDRATDDRRQPVRASCAAVPRAWRCGQRRSASYKHGGRECWSCLDSGAWLEFNRAQPRGFPRGRHLGGHRIPAVPLDQRSRCSTRTSTPWAHRLASSTTQADRVLVAARPEPGTSRPFGSRPLARTAEARGSGFAPACSPLPPTCSASRPSPPGALRAALTRPRAGGECASMAVRLRGPQAATPYPHAGRPGAMVD